MSTVLEVAGLAALAVGAFFLVGLGLGLVVCGAAAFLYAQTLDDKRLAAQVKVVASVMRAMLRLPKRHKA